jgi:DNA endonuclease
VRPVLERDELYRKVLELRADGLSYNHIIKEVQRTTGVRLRKSHLHDWITGKHKPLGSVRAFAAEPSPELAYLIGVSKGDADLGINRWNYRVRLRAVDKDFVQTFNHCASVVLGTKPHSMAWIQKRGQWSVEICSLKLYRFLQQPLRKLKVTMEHCENCIASFLRGFFDSEGSMSGRSLTVSNTRLVTLACVRRLLRRLGVSTTGPYLKAEGGRIVLIKGRFYKANRNVYYLRVRAKSLERFRVFVGFSIGRKSKALSEATSPHSFP